MQVLVISNKQLKRKLNKLNDNRPTKITKVLNEEEDDELPIINPLDLLKSKNEMIYKNGNHIYFRESINFETINKLGKLIDNANNEYELLVSTLQHVEIIPKPIYLHITCQGGLMFAGLLGSDMIKNSRIPIYTVVEGNVASAGTLLSIVGKKRFMTENSYMLIHQLSATETGNFEQLTDEHENNNEFMKRIKEIYTKHTKLTKRQLDNLLKHDIYWNFDKAKKNGLVDDVYKPDIIYKTVDD